MATAEELWQEFLNQFEREYEETFNQAIPTRFQGSTQDRRRANILTSLTPKAIIEIRRRQGQGQSDGKIVGDLMNKARVNITGDGGGGNKMGFGGGEDFTFTFAEVDDVDGQADAMFDGLFTERIAEQKGTIQYTDPDDPGGSGRASGTASGTGTTTGGAVDYLQDANDMIRQLGGPGAEGSAIPTKIKDVFLVTSVTNPEINGYYGPNADGALVLQGDRLEDVDVDEATKYTHGFDLDGKQYRMNNDTGDIEVRGTVAQYGMPGQRTGDWEIGTIRMTERPEEESIRWGTFTDDTGTWQYDLDNPTDRTKIAEAQQDIGFSTRFNPNTQQYETVRIDMRTGEQMGDFLGQSYDAFADTRDFTQRASQFETTEDRLADQFRQSFGLEQQRFGEDQRQFDTGFGETQRQFDTTEGRMERTLAANNYFNSLEELGRNYRTFIQTAPQMANAATNQGQLIADILRSGGDVLARTYFTRGGISPLPEITQADLINNLNSEMAKIQQYEVDATTAENRRREAADLQRAQGEYAQFKSARQLEAQRAYDQYKAGSRPYQVSSEVSTPNVAGFEAARDKYRDETAGQLSDMAKSFAQLPDFVIDKQFGGMDRQTLSDMADEAAGAVRAGGAVDTDTVETLGLQYTGPQQSQFMDTQTVSETVTPQVKEYSDWLTTSQFGTPTMGFDQWSTQVGPSFAPTPLLNVPQVPVPHQMTQPELIQNVKATTPPAVASVLSGQMPTPMQFGGLPLPTFQQLQALTPTEQEMLNTRLLTEFNVPLEDVAWQSRRQFGTPSMERNRDLARFRGYAV